MSLVVEGQTYQWEGGTLEELLSLLAEAALTVRVDALHADRDEKLGELHVVAGGVSETIAGDRRGDAAMAYLRQIPGLRFLAQPVLPDPEDGSLGEPGPHEGSLANRPPPMLMRYCESFVLTCALELRQGEDQVRISYRRGEILRTLVNGSESGERLPEVMAWTDGTWRIALPQLTLPRPAKAARPLRGPVVDSSTIFGYQVQPVPIPGGASGPPPAPMNESRQVTAPYTNASSPVPRLRRSSDGPTPMVETGVRAIAQVTLEDRRAGPHGPGTMPATATAGSSSSSGAAAAMASSAASSPASVAAVPTTAARGASGPVAVPAVLSVAESRPRQSVGGFFASLLLHALLGVALGLAIVGGYWAFLRWGSALRLG